MLSSKIISAYQQSSVIFYKSFGTFTRLLPCLLCKLPTIGKSRIFGGDLATGIPLKFVANLDVCHNGDLASQKARKISKSRILEF